MTTFTAGGQAAGFIAKPELDRLITVAIGRLDLQHAAGAGLNDRYRYGIAAFVKYLCHPDLAAEYSNRHRNIPVILLLGGSQKLRCRHECQRNASAYPQSIQFIRCLTHNSQSC
jgi:hypothetical protein